MHYEMTPRLDDATYVHPNVAKSYQHDDFVEQVLELTHAVDGVATKTPTARVYAKKKENGLGEEALLVVKGPDGMVEAFWLYSEYIPDVAGTLVSNDYVVTYADQPKVEAKHGRVHIETHTE